MVRIRIVCVSHTHGYGPQDGAFKLPKSDVLIHAGDLSNQGTLSELRKAKEWIESADFEVKIVIAGNHDITLDSNFYGLHWQSFHNQKPESSNECKDLFSKSSIIYLDHESAVIRLSRPDGPRSKFKIFESPSHCDQNKRGSLGCEYLRQALWRVRPRLTVCGHVHEGRGFERVRWNTAPQSEAFQELSSVRGELPPPGSKKQNLIDLTGRIQHRLQNDGSLIPLLPMSTAYHAPLPAESNASTPGRNETCIVNASIMATNWPHRGGKRFNNPLVVDLDLPADE
ncbi:hypothetical protein ACO22_02112 [Paracoccidioides brasiliensis]|uniref:Calcineurin-like phosphoesterase domain-containing protein n=1 Tax=Paracoccidioides brasiliensis TaxID=121759 RepID=A0A1D2JJJ7_PARBR|nr:hypothetical protein ACO22_02112 [Paracoccidioides brasiliensis]